MDIYEKIKELYENKLGIDGCIVDLLADYEIMYYCVTGLSNQAISQLLSIEEEAVKEVLLSRFDFSGWETTLSFSPIYIYSKAQGFESIFYSSLIGIYKFPKNLSKKALEICKLFEMYENILNEKFN